MQKFIILSAPRTGSNYLLSLLNSHSKIKCQGELFCYDWQISTQLKQETNIPESLIKQRYKKPEEFLDSILWISDQKMQVIGFKLFYDHGRTKNKELGNLWYYLKSLKNLKIIHLKRKNLLKRKLSFEIVKKTNIWSSKTEKNDKDIKLKLSEEE